MGLVRSTARRHDASQYKDYVLFMLFIKYVSDKYANYSGFDPPVVIPKGASFADMAKLKGKPEARRATSRDLTQAMLQELLTRHTRLV